MKRSRLDSDLQARLDEEGYLSINDFCAYLKQYHRPFYVSHPTMYRMVESGKVRGTKIGETYRILRAEVERYVKYGSYDASQETGGHQPSTSVHEEVAPVLKPLDKKDELSPQDLIRMGRQYKS